jgi:hypothetical protein
MSWSAVFVAFLVSHLVGDFLLQTDWQARRKAEDPLRNPVARRALLHHGATYALAFVPALLWIGDEQNAGVALGIGALVVLPHLAVDEGSVVRGWIGTVKRYPEPVDVRVRLAVDQSFHAVALLGAALVAAG